MLYWVLQYFTRSRNLLLRHGNLDYFKVNCTATGSRQAFIFECCRKPKYIFDKNVLLIQQHKNTGIKKMMKALQNQVFIYYDTLIRLYYHLYTHFPCTNKTSVTIKSQCWESFTWVGGASRVPRHH